MPSLPQIDIKKNIVYSPHVVIIGAGGSLASFPNGDAKDIKLPLMNNLIEVLNLEPTFNKYNIQCDNKNFEEVYSYISQNKKFAKLCKYIEREVANYFSNLIIPNKITLYDKIILSLRSKDLIATFNWDPLLIQAYRRNSHLKELPKILFLHGNVGVGQCPEHNIITYIDKTCPKCGNKLKMTKLLFPVTKKNYKFNLFIKNQWEILEHYIRFAFFVTIWGYSAPNSDIDAKELMKLAWDTNKSKDLNEIELIDIKKRNELKNNWTEFIVKSHYRVSNELDYSSILRFPRRSCESLAWAILQCDPWNEYPIPNFKILKHLQNWFSDLIEEENEHFEKGLPLKRY